MAAYSNTIPPPMNIWLGQRHAPKFPQGAAVTIGNYDGVHLGNKHILQKLKREA
ncbi:bifunctional riboflavin kinase/FAD synthetase, partial [Neisseria sp. P0015.S004]